MLLIRSLVYNAFFYLFMAVLGILGAPFAIWSRNGAYMILRTYTTVTLAALRLICGLSYEVRGEPPEGEILIAAKHQSFLDILILFHVLSRPKFIMKRELVWAPFIGLYALRIGSTAVQRGGRGASVNKMAREVDKERSDPGQLVIYPQGTRVAPGAKAPYKVGAGVLYQRSGNACVLAATNAGAFWGRKTILRRPGVAVVEFHETLPAGMELDAFMAAVEEKIEAGSEKLLQEVLDAGSGAHLDPAG